MSDELLLEELAVSAEKAGLGDARPQNLRPLSGGSSKESWSFDLVTERQRRGLILRRALATARFADDRTISLAAEAQLLQALGPAGLPVPAVAFALREGSPAGAGYAMQRIAGETVGMRILKDDSLADARRDLAFRCGEVLAGIHAVPPTSLPALDRVAPRAALDRLDARYRALGQPRPVFDLAIRWLRERLPEVDGLVLVHGDFRNGNLVVGPEGLRAVLDWEMAHIGHAGEDLGWLCTSSWRFQRPDLPVGGFGSREDLLAGYRAAGGRSFAPEELQIWEAFGSLNWGIMCGEAGAACAAGIRSVETAMIARRASETEFDLLEIIAPRGASHA